MGLIEILFIAVGLSMDAFAVSISCGLTMEKPSARHALLIALFFGGFQALMPIIGYIAGMSVRDLIGGFDHWIAFGLLAFVGSKMIHESISSRGDDKRMDPTSMLTLFILAVATSIDALAVGLSLSLLQTGILRSALIIGAVTFTISLFGVLVGKQTGSIFGNKVEILGGAILIAIGLRILFVHIC